MPNYITQFDTVTPEITLFTTSASDKGTHSLAIQSWIELNPSDRLAETEITLTFEILIDPCLDGNELYPVSFDDMAFKIDHFSEPTEQTFDIVTDKVGLCGPVIYSISGNYLSDLVTLEAAKRAISVFTDSGLDVGTYQVDVLASLQDYPVLTNELGITMSFTVTVTSICS